MTRPSKVSSGLSFFDRMATKTAQFASRASFFAFCVIVVVVWLPSYFVFRSVDTWQLIINTLTTIITFLLMALLQNTQARADAALQKKLNAVAAGIADLMGQYGHEEDAKELRAAVGLEEREGTSGRT